MEWKRKRQPVDNGGFSPAAAKLNRLPTPDLFLACEQSLMVAQQSLGQAMREDDPLYGLELMDEAIVQAKAASEVLHARA